MFLSLGVHANGFSFVFSLGPFTIGIPEPIGTLIIVGVEAKKLYNDTVMDLGVSIRESVKVESLEDFISHLKLELWETLFFHEFKLKHGILKCKT